MSKENVAYNSLYKESPAIKKEKNHKSLFIKKSSS
jgi:hypothetical protein